MNYLRIWINPETGIAYTEMMLREHAEDLIRWGWVKDIDVDTLVKKLIRTYETQVVRY